MYLTPRAHPRHSRLGRTRGGKSAVPTVVETLAFAAARGHRTRGGKSAVSSTGSSPQSTARGEAHCTRGGKSAVSTDPARGRVGGTDRCIRGIVMNITMGVTHIDVTVRNPADRTRSWEGRFLVDTGAIDSLVPRPRLEAIGIEPIAQRVYELADGTEITMDIAGAQLELMGEVTAGLIIFGDADAEPLLGVTALESAGIEVDPQSQRLKKLPAVRLKSVRRRARA